MSLFKLLGGEWGYWGYWVHAGRGLPAVKCQVCFQWDCASGPLCWSSTRFAFLRENDRVNDGRFVPNVTVSLVIRWHCLYLPSCKVCQVLCRIICKALHAKSRNTLLIDVPCVFFCLFFSPVYHHWFNITCGFSYYVITYHVVICVIDSCLHIKGQWMWLYNFMIPSNSITRVSRQPSASVLANIWLVSICFGHLLFFFCFLHTMSSHFASLRCSLLPSSIKTSGFPEDSWEAQFVISSFWVWKIMAQTSDRVWIE